MEIQVELEEIDAEGLGDGEIFQLDVFDTIIGQEGEESDDDEDDDEDVDLSDISSDAGSIEDDSKPKEEEMDVRHVHDMVTKLDCILEVVFKHLDRLHSSISKEERPSTPTSSPTSLKSQKTLAQRQVLAQSRFHSLLSIFERTILRTFKSRYTQFLVFWYSSLDTQFRDHFLGTVVSKALLEPDQPVVTRAAAASYVASYVSRASFVDREEARSVVAVLCKFLETHLDAFDDYAAQSLTGKIAQQSSEQHAVFYASAQAVFLIFCFRWRDLMERDSDGDADEIEIAFTTGATSHRAWQSELNVMQRVVNSPLNPLKVSKVHCLLKLITKCNIQVCSPSVVKQFAQVAQKVGFIYCYSIIEANKRLDYAGSSSKGSHSSLYSASLSQSFDVDLTTFFPFDPFKLPKSCSYIDGIYREWSDVAIEESEDEDDDDDDDAEDDDDEEEEEEEEEVERSSVAVEDDDSRMLGPSSYVDDAGGLGKSFGGMSISPAQTRQVALAL